jgi:chemotaxis protein methyltransferase CheR
MNLTNTAFKNLIDLFYKNTGIRLEDHKKYLLINRLDKFVGVDKTFLTFEDYYKALIKDKTGNLIREFVNRLTTNYSFFFREEVHFRFLKYYFLSRIKDKKYIRIWSAGCSTGEEPYSIAILARNTISNLDEIDFKILATDISTRVLEVAKRGIYDLSKINNKSYVHNFLYYFKKYDDGNIEVKEEIKKYIVFNYLNLLSGYPFKKQFDIVFLRNVLIYFNNKEKEIILNKIYNYIKPDGYLILGLSESLLGVNTDFKTIKYSIFKK